VNSTNFIFKVLEEYEKSSGITEVYNKSKTKIMEPKHKTLAKNKNFLTEYKTICDLFITNQETLKYESDILDRGLTFKLESEIIRKIIGFTTTGGFSYSNSLGIGKGFILLDSYEDLLKMKNLYKLPQLNVLIRNKNSRVYYMANIKILSI
jgi:hypothetical protein